MKALHEMDFSDVTVSVYGLDALGEFPEHLQKVLKRPIGDALCLHVWSPSDKANQLLALAKEDGYHACRWGGAELMDPKVHIERIKKAEKEMLDAECFDPFSLVYRPYEDSCIFGLFVSGLYRALASINLAADADTTSALEASSSPMFKYYMPFCITDLSKLPNIKIYGFAKDLSESLDFHKICKKALTVYAYTSDIRILKNNYSFCDFLTDNVWLLHKNGGILP